MTKRHTVVVILEAKPEREAELKQALVKVIQPSRAEKACLEYRLHQDPDKPTQFILYENWESKEAHLEQFTKPYIMEFAAQISDLLARPYLAYFGQEVQ